MKQVVFACDFLGFSPSVHVDNKLRSQSIFTGFLSIVIILVSALATCYFSFMFISDAKPTVLRTFGNQDNFGPYNVSNTGFNAMLAITSNEGKFISDSRIYTVKAYQETLKPTIQNGEMVNIYSVLELEVGKCSKYYQNSDILETNIKMALDNVYCVKPDQATIYGYWGAANGFTMLRVTFQKCVNNTQNNFSCFSPDKINNEIQGSYISMDFSNYVLDERNYTAPLQKVIYDDYNLLNSGSSLMYNVHLKPISFVSDNGILLENNVNYVGFSESHKIFNSNFETNEIVAFTFQGDPASDIYIRNYPKLQTILTQIGGFVKFIMLCGNLISALYSKNFFFTQLLFSMTKHCGLEDSNDDRPRESNVILNKPSVIKFQIERKSDTPHVNYFKLPDNKKIKNNNCNSDVKANLILIKKSGYCKFISERVIGSLMCCEKWESKKIRYKLIERISNVYLKSTSVGTIINKFYDLEIIKEKVLGKIENYNIEYNTALAKIVSDTRNSGINGYEIFNLSGGCNEFELK